MAKFRYELNGVPFETSDPLEDCRTILQRGGFTPPSDHVLIELTVPGSRSVGLDEKVDLAAGHEAFRAFASDRVFSFTVDERGYEWGAGHIDEVELREIAKIPAGHVMLIERQDAPDEIIEPGAQIDLTDRGTEHIRSERRRYRIIVNARKHEIAEGAISYDALIALAFNPVPSSPDITFSITYSKGLRPDPEGSVPEGTSVAIKNGMIFVVTQTNRS